jgi:hypothetical protein
MTDPFWVHTCVPLETLAVKEEPDWLTDTVLVDEHEAARALLLMLSLKFQVPARFKVLGAVELLPQAISTAAIVSAISVRIVFSLFEVGNSGVLNRIGRFPITRYLCNRARTSPSKCRFHIMHVMVS